MIDTQNKINYCKNIRSNFTHALFVDLSSSLWCTSLCIKILHKWDPARALFCGIFDIDNITLFNIYNTNFQEVADDRTKGLKIQKKEWK